MEKKTYEAPEMEVIELENDVILTSGESEVDYSQWDNDTCNYTTPC